MASFTFKETVEVKRKKDYDVIVAAGHRRLRGRPRRKKKEVKRASGR
jgi:uncharacterized C2H2 Zn-finger protein